MAVEVAVALVVGMEAIVEVAVEVALVTGVAMALEVVAYRM